jgi:hypothetical protein
MDDNQNRRGAIAGDRGDENTDQERIEHARTARGGWGFIHRMDYTLPSVILSFLRAQVCAGRSSIARGRAAKPKLRVENVSLDNDPVCRNPKVPVFLTFGLMTPGCELC